MSNLNNVYLNCPGLMSDGRGQPTDYKSHNEILKQTKQDSLTSYDYRVKLQGSGLRDMADNIRYNMCGQVPAGEIKLDRNINLVVAAGNYLDAFAPLSSASFFKTPAPPVVVATPELTRPATKLPAYSAYNAPSTPSIATAAAPATMPSTMAPMMAPTMAA